MQVILYGPENHNAYLDKFVVTLFLDEPDAGKGLFFAEVCSSKTDTFRLVIPKSGKPCSEPALYLDKHSCSRLFSGYQLINESTGEHLQRVGETILRVEPAVCNITEVAPPEAHREYAAYHISLGGPPSEDSLRGTWLLWEQPRQTGYQRDVTIPFDFKLRLEGISIGNFYFFIVLPANYRSQNAICEISSHRAAIDRAPITNPVHEFELDRDFSVFPVWRTWIYGRKILRNRDALSIKGGEKISVFIKATSDVIATRMTTLSYFIGIGFALSASVLANSIFHLQQNGLQFWPAAETAVSGIVTIVLGLLGWKVLRK